MKYYFKFLGHDRQPCYGGRGQWPPPGEWTVPVSDLIPYERGYHLCRKHDLVYWSDAPTLWIVEADLAGSLVKFSTVVVRRARLVRQVEEWNEKTKRLFATVCAENVLMNFELLYPDDTRPRRAIETARNFAQGQSSFEELVAAGDAAERASCYTNRSYARYAARSAARSTRSSTRASASCAISSSRAIESIWSEEHTWQSDHLLTSYLNLNPEEFE